MSITNGLNNTDKKYFKRGVILFSKTPRRGMSNAIKVEKVTVKSIKVRYLYDDLSESQESNVYFKREIWRIRKYWIKSREKLKETSIGVARNDLHAIKYLSEL